MNCFNHPDVPAVGICKYCQKGLCMECAIDLGHGIACKNHREEVEVLDMRLLSILYLLGVVLFLSGFLMDTIDTNSVLRTMGTGMIVLTSLIWALIYMLRKSRNKRS